jgi:hypothetical protein
MKEISRVRSTEPCRNCKADGKKVLMDLVFAERKDFYEDKTYKIEFYECPDCKENHDRRLYEFFLSGERKEKEEFHKHVNNMHLYEN